MADLSRWDPFREMMTLRNAMDRLFESSFVGPDFVWHPEAAHLAVDVIENQDEFLVKASVPGINPDDLEITWSNNVLTIKGEIKAETDVEEQHYLMRERRYGSFSRSFSLPTNINPDSIQANYSDGVLVLKLPKVEEAKPKRITVKSSPVLEAKIAGNKN
jgi:HSP20 family protein